MNFHSLPVLYTALEFMLPVFLNFILLGNIMRLITPLHIQQTVTDQILHPDQAEKLTDYLFRRTHSLANRLVPEEPFLMFRGFSDIFLLIGLCILVSAANGLLAVPLLFSKSDILIVVWATLSLGIAFAASHYYVKKKRLFLISLLLITDIIIITFILFLQIDNMPDTDSFVNFMVVLPVSLYSFVNSMVVLPVSLLCILSVYYYLFRSPIIPPFLIILLIFALHNMLITPEDIEALLKEAQMSSNGQIILGLTPLVTTLLLLTFALYYERKDSFRQSLASQKAFWFYIFAGFSASLCFFILTELPLADTFLSEPHYQIFFFMLLSAMACLSLWVNRRSLLISFLTFSIIFLCFSDHFSINHITQSIPDNNNAAFILMIGLFMTFIGSFWSTLHLNSIKLMPQVLKKILPHTATPPATQTPLIKDFTAQPEDLYRAGELNLITPKQITYLLTHSQQQTQSISPEKIQGEQFDFIKGYTNILIATGLTLLQLGLIGLVNNFTEEVNFLRWRPILLVTVVQLLLTLYFIRYRRLKLPGMILLIGLSLHISAHFILAGYGPYYVYAAPVLAIVYYYIFRLPFSLYLAAFSGAILMQYLVVDSNISSDDFFYETNATASIIYGIFILGLAMFFDLRDPDRQTRFSQNAFWLHLIAAPSIVHAFAWPLLFEETSYTAILLLSGLVPIAILAIIIDRRSFLLSASLYLLAAMIKILMAYTDVLGSDTMPMITLSLFLLIGFFLTSIGSFWENIRYSLLNILPNFPGKDKLPPPHPLAKTTN